MRTRFVLVVFLAAVIAIVGFTYVWMRVGVAGSALPLRLVEADPLSGTTARFDYASIDPKRGLIWIAHMGDGAVEAVDIARGEVRQTISLGPTASVRGVLAANGKVYAAAQGRASVVILDGSTGKQLATVRIGDVDGLAYDPGTQQIFVSDERGERDAVIDGRTNELVGFIALGGEAGNTVYDATSHHVFVGIQTSDELAEIDPVRRSVIRRYALAGCRSSHSVLVDSAQRMVYVGCQYNTRLVRLDLRTGHVDASGGVGIGVDVLALDAGLHRVYAASESGIVSVYDVAGRRFRRVAQAFVHLHAHVVAVDSRTHRVYFPLQDVAGRPVMWVMEPH